MPCTFGTWVPNFEGLYQQCNCGKHVWSVRTHKSLKINKADDSFNLYNTYGLRSVVYIDEPKIRCSFSFFQFMIYVLCFLLAVLAIFVVIDSPVSFENVL